MISAMLSTKVRRARRPLLVIGHEAEETELEKGKKVIDYAVKIVNKGNLTVVATSQALRGLVKRGVHPASMNLVDLIQRLSDPGWKGVDGKGGYDIVLFLGFPRELLSQALSTLRHFAPRVKTISLDRYYQSNADWSFLNLSITKWRDNLASIVSGLRG